MRVPNWSWRKVCRISYRSTLETLTSRPSFALHTYGFINTNQLTNQLRKEGTCILGASLRSPDPPLTWLTWLTWVWLAHLTPLLRHVAHLGLAGSDLTPLLRRGSAHVARFTLSEALSPVAC